MITLKSKPYNAILKGDGTSVFAELEGQPIVGIHYDYTNFCRRDALFDPLAGGDATFYLKNGDIWVFEIRGIDVQSIVTLRRELGNLFDAIPMELHPKFDFLWKSCMNSKGRVRNYCAVTYDYLPIFYNLLKRFDIVIKSDDDKQIPYFVILDK